MTNRIPLTPFTVAFVLATFALLVPDASGLAQERPAARSFAQLQQGGKAEENRAAPVLRGAQPSVAPHQAKPRIAAPRRAVSRTVTQSRIKSRVVRQANTNSKAAGAVVVKRRLATAAVPHVVTPHGTKTVTASRLRGTPASGAGRTVIRGKNYSTWRSGYRVRYGNSWRTFVALGTLGAIAIGAREYYPYAYISAPATFCVGLTEDGCELNWREVQTIEGDVVDQCVAYCPWQ